MGEPTSAEDAITDIGHDAPSGKKFLKDADLSSLGIDYQIFLGEGDFWDGSFAQYVKNLHDGTHRRGVSGESLEDSGIPPNVVYIAATNAIPYAYAIRECWRTAYPHEDHPRFFFIDVVSKGSLEGAATSEDDIDEILLRDTSRLVRIGEKYDAFAGKTAVFDEVRGSGDTARTINSILTRIGYSDIAYLIGGWEVGWGNILEFPELSRPIVRRLSSEPDSQNYLALNNNPNSQYLVASMKELGTRMGQSIITHLT